MGTAPAFASVGEAMEAARAALGYLAVADAVALAAESQAECLRGLERTEAVLTAARASVLSAFTAGKGYSADADYSARVWLMHKTGITRGAAASHTAWAKRYGTHPKVVAALAAGELSESYGRAICQWTDKLPEKYRDQSDELLVAAAAEGLGLADLSALFAEMYERARADLPDEDPDRAFADRGVRLETTFAGAGVLNGDLTPECAAVVAKVLDALSAPAGKDDDRTRDQRYHDALAEAMRRLVAAKLLPERAGQPVKVWAHISLADLMRLDGDSALQQQWTAQVRARWAARRAAASGTGSDGGVWLDGDAAEAIACDAAMAPDRDRGRQHRRAGRPGPAVRGTGRAAAGRRSRGRGLGGAGAGGHRQGRGPAVRAGRAGAASCAAGSSAPGWAGRACRWTSATARSIPAGIRNAVMLRDQHCQWAGRCDQPAAACQVHHTRHKANGGPDVGQGLRAPVLVPPSDRDPPVGLDPGPEP